MPEDLETLASFRARYLAMPQRQADLIAECRAKGRTWAQIGEALGMTQHGAIRASKPTGNPQGWPKGKARAQPGTAAE